MSRVIIPPPCPDGAHYYRYGWFVPKVWLGDGAYYTRTLSRTCERCQRSEDVEQRILVNSSDPATNGTSPVSPRD